MAEADFSDDELIIHDGRQSETAAAVQRGTGRMLRHMGLAFVPELPLVTGRRDGTGLGLSLSQQIAAAHGGMLAFEPLEQGSRFSLFLPFSNGQSSQAAEVNNGFH